MLRRIVAPLVSAWRTLARQVCESTFQVECCIQGYNVFKSTWNPTTGEELNCVRERTNTEDPYAVGVIHRSAVVGRVPQKMSAACATESPSSNTV